jgi:hypothetical protein
MYKTSISKRFQIKTCVPSLNSFPNVEWTLSKAKCLFSKWCHCQYYCCFYQHLEWCDTHFVNFNVLKDFSSIFQKSSIWSMSYPLVRQFNFQIESTNFMSITHCLMGMLWMFLKISQIFASQQNQHVSKTFLKILIMNFTFY